MDVSGISTFQGNVGINTSSGNSYLNFPIGNNIATADIIHAGTAIGDYTLYTLKSSNQHYIRQYTSGYYNVSVGGTNAFVISNTDAFNSASENPAGVEDADISFVVNPESSTELRYNYNKKLETTGYGVSVYGGLNVSGLSTFTGAADFNGDIDVDGHTELDDVNVSGVTTTSGLLDINAGGQANTFKVEDLTNDCVVIAGTGGELEDDGNFTFTGTELTVGTATTGVVARTDGTLNVSGVSTFQGSISLDDNVQIVFGDGTDLLISSNGSNGLIRTGSGSNLIYRSASHKFRNQTGTEELAVFTENGSVELYYDNQKKFETTSTGIKVLNNRVDQSNNENTIRDTAVISGPRNIILDPSPDDIVAIVDGVISSAGVSTITGITTTNIAVGNKIQEIDGIISAGTTVTSVGISSLTISNVSLGATDNQNFTFLDLTPTGIVRIKGDLYVDGTRTEINSTTLTVDDLNVVVASGATNGLTADTAGLTVDGANAYLKYNYNAGTNETWELNKNVGIGTDNATAKLDVDGTLNVSGVSTFQSHVELGDNDELRIGDGQDLEIFHASNNSYIRNGTGDLYIRNLANDKDVVIQSDDGAGGYTSYFRANGVTGGVQLYHYGIRNLLLEIMVLM